MGRDRSRVRYRRTRASDGTGEPPLGSGKDLLRAPTSSLTTALKEQTNPGGDSDTGGTQVSAGTGVCEHGEVAIARSNTGDIRSDSSETIRTTQGRYFELIPEYPVTKEGNVTRAILEATVEAKSALSKLRSSNDPDRHDLYHRSEQYYLGVLDGLGELVPRLLTEAEDRQKFYELVEHRLKQIQSGRSEDTGRYVKHRITPSQEDGLHVDVYRE